MSNMHTSLTKKIPFAFFLSFLTASPVSAACPSGYGAVEGHKNIVFSAAMLNYGVAYSPEFLERCVDPFPDSSEPSYSNNVKCGSLSIVSLQDSLVSIKPADPSLGAVYFEDLNADNLSAFNLPRDFQDGKVKEWCEMDTSSSNSATCYEEYKTTKIYVPSQSYGNAIRKKIFVERRYQTINKCRMISF